MESRPTAKVTPLRPRSAAASSAEVAPEAFDPSKVLIELNFIPEPNLCMRTVTSRRVLNAEEVAEVGRQLRRLQQMLLSKYNQQTGAGSESGTDAPTEP